MHFFPLACQMVKFKACTPTALPKPRLHGRDAECTTVRLQQGKREDPGNGAGCSEMLTAYRIIPPARLIKLQVGNQARCEGKKHLEAKIVTMDLTES